MPLRDLSQSPVSTGNTHVFQVAGARVLYKGGGGGGGGRRARWAYKGILKKVNLRQLHLDTLLSFPKAISRRTKLGTAAAWSGVLPGGLKE